MQLAAYDKIRSRAHLGIAAFFMKNKVFLTGIGHASAENKIDNSFFEDLDIETSAQWIEDKTGIQSRYSVLSKEQIAALRHKQTSFTQLREANRLPLTESLAAQPWQQASDRAEFADSPDIVISGCSTPDYKIPATASIIAAKLGIQATAIDVNSACSSFVTDLSVARALIDNGSAVSAAIFNIERYTTTLDFSDRSSCIIFGDGGTAAILQAGESLSGFEVIDVITDSSPRDCHQVVIPIEKCFWQNGSAVQKFAISKTCEITRNLLEENGLSTADVNYFIGHQANLRMLSSVCKRLEIAEDKHLYNIDQFANQGAAGAPSVLSQNWDRFKPGEIVVIAVVGAGLTWGAALLKKC